jgi:hypothetical protein
LFTRLLRGCGSDRTGGNRAGGNRAGGDCVLEPCCDVQEVEFGHRHQTCGAVDVAYVEQRRTGGPGEQVLHREPQNLRAAGEGMQQHRSPASFFAASPHLYLAVAEEVLFIVLSGEIHVLTEETPMIASAPGWFKGRPGSKAGSRV